MCQKLSLYLVLAVVPCVYAVEQPKKAPEPIEKPETLAAEKATTTVLDDEDPFAQFERMQQLIQQLDEQMWGLRGTAKATTSQLQTARSIVTQTVDDNYVVITIAAPTMQGTEKKSDAEQKKITINGYKRKLAGTALFAGYELQFAVTDGNLFSLTMSNTEQESSAGKKLMRSVTTRNYVESLRYPVSNLENTTAEFNEAEQKLIVRLPRDKQLERERFGVEIPVTYTAKK
ncbi:hypothetical protein M1466_00335 [Candidatus Dependentiae bacterium]|nr:hypothetical protein [Candidatus Dependentiae bacterium]